MTGWVPGSLMDRREYRARRLPLFRVGLTLVVGSVVYSMMRFYVNLAAMFDPAAREAPPSERGELARHLMRELFTGTVAGVLLWGGCALMLARVLIGWRRKPRRAD